jgi:iron complex outermembrane receptor protein
VIDAYFITDLLASYTLKPKWAKEVNVSLMVNNVFDAMYESNGYTWGYMWDGFLYQQNNYYPQAGTNFLTSLTLKF